MEKYIEAEMEIVEFESEDVITTSCDPDNCSFDCDPHMCYWHCANKES